MTYVSWLLYFCIFVFLVSFSLQNTHTTFLQYYLGFKWTAPAYMIALGILLTGVFIGMMLSLGVILKQRKSIKQLQQTKTTSPNAL